MAISKTDFVRALQCPKMMWLDKHKPEEKIIPPEVRERLDEGNEFGDSAMGMFGEYVEVTAFKEDGRLDYSKMIADTARYIENGTRVICEAAFSYYGNYCAADILKREDDGSFSLYEVKNSPEVKEVFLQDVGFQRYIVKKCGVKLKRAYIVTNDGGLKINDVTKESYKYEKLAYEKVFEFSKIKNLKDEFETPIGERCENPYRCWYYDYCRR